MADGAFPAKPDQRALLDAVWTPCSDGRQEVGVVRLIAASPDSPIMHAVLSELRALPASMRPRVLALLGREDGANAQALAGFGVARALDLRGGRDLRELALFGAGALWLGRRLAETPQPVAEGLLLNLPECAADSGDIARLTFDSAWALSAPAPRSSVAELRARAVVALRRLFGRAETRAA